ncbi:hypothetical protein [Streptomyces sp. NBC_01431]|uniref:hypothetical protein n=1 Tax=Streptomyces sp. NBC_01431 TaxID=2903863 RepID=UPI002E2EDD57|nr:hypothetical protein [Streptomyces sp. NBC_01431]
MACIRATGRTGRRGRLAQAAELLRLSCYCCKFSTVAVMHSLLAVEIALCDRIPDAGKEPLHGLITKASLMGS